MPCLDYALNQADNKTLVESDCNLSTTVYLLTKHKEEKLAKKLFDKIDLNSLADSQDPLVEKMNHYDLLHGIVNVREVHDYVAFNVLKYVLDSEGERINAGASSGLKENGVEKDVFLVASQQVQEPPAPVDLDLIRLLISSKKVLGLKAGLADLALFMLDEKYVNEQPMQEGHASNITVRELEDRSKLFNDEEGRNKEWMIEVLKNYQLEKPDVDLGDVLTQLKLQHGVEILPDEVLLDQATQEITPLKGGEIAEELDNISNNDAIRGDEIPSGTSRIRRVCQTISNVLGISGR